MGKMDNNFWKWMERGQGAVGALATRQYYITLQAYITAGTSQVPNAKIMCQRGIP
jgi:hypothetical protein